MGRLVSVADAKENIVTTTSYDVLGNVVQVQSKQGASTLKTTTHEYDPIRHWLVGIDNKDGAGKLLSSFDYTRRADGQILTLTESVKQHPSVDSFEDVTATYTYDAINRLTKEEVNSSVAGKDYTKEYVLDLVGNRTKLVETKEGQSAVTTTSTYNARDQLLTETTGTTTIEYGYDSNGSLITQTGRTQSWDLRGRLSGATVDGTTTSYRYTPDGIRSSVTEGSTTIDYIIDGMTPSGYQQVVEERDGSGLLVVRYTYGASLDPISEARGGTSALYLGDGHSGVRQAIDLLGAVVLAQRFDAFGVSMRRDGLAKPIGYRGERFDTTPGQYYLRARYYDPRSGRFTGVDPFAGNMSDPLQLMRYGYAAGNPILNQDPTGQFLLGAGIGILAGIGVAYGGHAVATWTKGGWAGAGAGALFGFASGFLLGLIDASFDSKLTTADYFERAAMFAVFGMALGAIAGARVGPPIVRLAVAAGILVLGGVLTYHGVRNAANVGNSDLAAFRGFSFATALTVGLKLNLGSSPTQGANPEIVPRPTDRSVINGLADSASGEHPDARPFSVGLGGFRGFFMSGRAFVGPRAEIPNQNHTVVNTIVAMLTHRNFGGCAECNVISRALYWIEFTTGRPIRTIAEARQWLAGGWIQVSRVGTNLPPNGGSHQQSMPPCQGPESGGGCTGLLNTLGITAIE
jgi:RHS repeat-associated protein